MNILISGAAGFIGRALLRRLLTYNGKIIGTDIIGNNLNGTNIAWEQADLTDLNSAAIICKKHSPDVVVHCAGIAHQKIGTIGFDTYMRVNSEATENLAKAAAKCNPNLRFIFLSSVSVYGEEDLDVPVSEESDCSPSSDYAASKLDAERRLITLSDENILCNLIILRLAPVYDREWSLNFDRRVLAPMKAVYTRFGTGQQKMSALARPNLVDFIVHILKSKPHPGLQIFNVCDANPYEFNTIIKVFKKSAFRPNHIVIPVPLSAAQVASGVAESLLPTKKKWIRSCYDKLAYDLVFDNGKMMETGFKPIHTLETIFLPGK